MLFGRQQQNIYDSVADTCRRIEYITKLDTSGKCYQQDFIFDKKTADRHFAELDKLDVQVRDGNEPGSDYAARLISEIKALYVNLRSDNLSDEVVAHAQIARLELATMCKMRSFTDSVSPDFLNLIKDEKDNINRTISFLASADDNKGIFAAYTKYSDTITKYIEFLEKSIADSDEQKDLIQEKDVPAEVNTQYKDAKKISELTEQVRSLEYELSRCRINEDKLAKALSDKEKECADYAAKAAIAEKERSMLLTDIDSVKRDAEASGRMKIELPLLVLAESEDEAWNRIEPDRTGYHKLFQRFAAKKADVNNRISDNCDIREYNCEVIESAGGLIPCSTCPFIQGFALYIDKSGRHYLIHKSNVNGSKASGQIFDIHISQCDEMLITVKYTDDDFKDLCLNKPSVITALPSFYSFMTDVIKLSMYNNICDTDAILQFNSYYAHLYMIAKDIAKSKTDIAIRALGIAAELRMLLKCFGNVTETDAVYIQKVAQKLIDNEKEMIQIPDAETISTNSDIAIYINELEQRIMLFPDDIVNERLSGNDIVECKEDDSNKTGEVNAPETVTSEPEDIGDYLFYPEEKASSPELSPDKYRRSLIPDFNNVKFIVSKTSNAGEDISLYAVENIDSAVSQYCFAIAPVKRIGVSVGDKRYYLMQSDNHNKSARLLDKRSKKFIAADGLLEIVEFYEFKLINAIRTVEDE